MSPARSFDARKVTVALLAAAILLGSVRPARAECSAGAGPVPVPVAYTSFNGTVLQLYAWDGRRVAVLTPESDRCPSTMARLLEALDGAYEFYTLATGREPARYPPTLHLGRSTIAVVPSSCGAGCGYLGLTGIEILPPYFEALYTGIRDRDQFDQVLFYELGRNFWFFGDKIDYPMENGLPDVGYATPYAILMRFLSMDGVGVQMTGDANRTADTIRSQIRGLVDRYVADPTASWQTAVRTVTRPDLYAPYSQEDFKASFLWRIESLSCNTFSQRFWREVGARPARRDSIEAADNLFVAASRNARANLTRVFVDLWDFPISQLARDQVAAELGPAVDPEPYAVPEIAKDVLVAPIGTLSSEAASIATRPDGGFVAGGWSVSGEESFALAAYTAAGAPDPAFGLNGRVGTVLGSQGSRIEGLAVDSSGRTIAVGWLRAGPEYLTVARYTETGSLDPTFGGINAIPGVTAHWIGTSGGRLHAVGVQANGRIVAAGYTTSGPDYLTVVRYLANGSLDESFGDGGVVGFRLGEDGGRANALAIQPDGRIVIAGHAGSAGREAFVVARLLPSGALDPSFGGIGAQPGVVRTPLGTQGGRAQALAVQSNGDIVVAGYSTSGPDYINVVRYDASGVRDTSFGGSGDGVTSIAVGGLPSRATAVAVQANGKIVIAGHVANPCGRRDMAVARLLADGTPDEAFGRHGTSVVRSGDGVGARGLAIARDGTILAAGSGGNAGGADFLVARIAGDEPTPAITSRRAVRAKLDRPFRYQITAQGSVRSFEAWPLPPGLGLDPIRGRISGVPTERGRTRIHLSAIGADGQVVATGVVRVKVR